MNTENLPSKDRDIYELPSNKKFGYFFSILFFLCGVFFFSIGQAIYSLVFLTMSILLLFVTIINARLLLPFNKLWSKLGLFLGTIISPIILGIIFFCIFTPVSILMKVAGRDELRLKKIIKPSYWRKRVYTKENKHDFKRQF